MNKFEQVSSDGHQMSLAQGVPVQWCPMSGLGELYSKVIRNMGNGHMVPLCGPLWTE